MLLHCSSGSEGLRQQEDWGREFYHVHATHASWSLWKQASWSGWSFCDREGQGQDSHHGNYL